MTYAYDLEYYELMLRNNSTTAKLISRIRWDWVMSVTPRTVLDYGSGVGWFRAYRPPGVDVFTYDIGAYPQTGIDFRLYDVVCFWDVLEHILDFSRIEPVLALARFVSITVPIKSPKKDYASWKHSKPSEHVKIFTESSLDDLLSYYGYKITRKGTPECPPREDITSFLYRNTAFRNRRNFPFVSSSLKYRME